MLEVKWLALLTVASHRVVLTVITHPSGDVSSGQVHRHVKVAGARMFVAVTLCATRPTSRKALGVDLPMEDGVAGKKLILETRDEVQATRRLTMRHP